MITNEETILCSQIAVLREQLVTANAEILELKERVSNLTNENEDLKTKVQKPEKPKNRKLDMTGVYQR